MTRALKAHFDGKVLVPDEPVDLPVNEPLQLVVSSENGSGRPSNIEDRLRALEAATGTISAPPIPLEALRRENLYDD